MSGTDKPCPDALQPLPSYRLCSITLSSSLLYKGRAAQISGASQPSLPVKRGQVVVKHGISVPVEGHPFVEKTRIHTYVVRLHGAVKKHVRRL